MEARVSEVDQAIVKRGANARAYGLTVFDNPYLKADQCPAATGETLEQWQAKHSAWEFGWRMEDAIASGEHEVKG